MTLTPKPPTDNGHFHNQKSNNGDMVDKAKHDAVSLRHLSSYIEAELLKTIKYTFKIFIRLNLKHFFEMYLMFFNVNPPI